MNSITSLSEWALANNLRLNRSKCIEVVFTDGRRKLQICHPPTIPDIQHVTSVKILGVTVTNRLSVRQHVHDVIAKCAQTMHALKLLWCHRLSSDELQVVYKAVVLAKLLHASPAWWGFATVADKQRIEAFLRRGVRLNLYSADDPTVPQCAANADDTLFRTVLANDHHIIHLLFSCGLSTHNKHDDDDDDDICAAKC